MALVSEAEPFRTTQPPRSAAPVPFPIEVFPEAISQFILEGAEALPCPPDFIATTILAVSAALIGSSRVLEWKGDYIARASIFAAIVADPGTRKSPAFDLAKSPLDLLQGRLYAQYKAEVAQFESEMRTSDNGNPKPARPTLKRLYTVDATTEALTLRLAENPRGLAIMADELTSLLRGLNQYKGGRGNDRAFYQSAWSSAPHMVDRKGQEPIFIPRVYLSIAGCIPPDVLPELRDEQGREDGFIDRFIFAYPERVKPDWLPDKIVSAAARESYRHSCESLLALNLPPGEEEPGVIRLDDEARRVRDVKMRMHVREIDDPRLPPYLLGPWSKLEGYFGRFTLVIHLLRQVAGECGDTVDSETIERAWLLLRYFKANARRVFAHLWDGGASDRELKTLRWISRQKDQTCTARDLQRSGMKGFDKPGVALAVLEALIDAGTVTRERKGKATVFILVSDNSPDTRHNR